MACAVFDAYPCDGRVISRDPRMENVMSSAESRLKPNHKMQLGHAAGVVQPAGFESKQGPNTRTASQAESLLAAEKRTLKMIADGASLKDILNDLCRSIDVEARLRAAICLTTEDDRSIDLYVREE